MYILGINSYYHDSSAALLKDGQVVAAAEEERFSRKKHDNSFPLKAAAFCLEQAGITIDQVDHVAFYEKPLLKFERLLSQHIAMFPRSMKTFLSSMPSWINEKLRVQRAIRKELGFKGDIIYAPHHMSHAAASYLPSPFEDAAVITVDGVGEWTTTTYGHAQGKHINLLKEIRFPHSLGLLYSTVTAYLGFSVNNSEYKVMGLAPYGNMDPKTNKFYKKLRKVVDVKEDGSFRMNLEYFTYHYKDRMPSKKFCELMGGPVSARDVDMTQRHKDIAAAVQLVTEEVMTKILHHVHKTTKSENVVLGGGVALNSVFNGKVLRNSPFKKIWIQPNASDGGNSLGAALYAHCCVLDKERNYQLHSAYLGPRFSTKEVRKFLEESNINYSEFARPIDVVEQTAELLSKNAVVGWFQGGMEWGPRALGARSILANPCNAEAKELLNTKVKHREKFRPFAPVVCADDANTYFDCDTPIPEPTDYMLMVYPVRKQWHKKIPSVTHVDGSGRLQTIREEQNPLYYHLIKAFGKLSGVPILINTSFNIRGEPIVCTPQDAYRCMMGTGIDYLVIDKFLIKREENPRDEWDSESLAKD